MSVQLYTQEQIVHHVENASPTKFMYTFSKAPRFPEIDKRGKKLSIYFCSQKGQRRKHLENRILKEIQSKVKRHDFRK